MTWNHGEDNYENFNVSFFDSIHLINQLHWNRVLEEENVYLSLSYLKSLEESLKNSISFRYMIFYDNKNNPVGIAVTQILDFVDKFRKYDEALCEIGSKIKNKLLGVRDIKVMVCGNVFACGENGFKFIEGTLPDIQLFNLTKALVRLRKSEKVNGNISMTLLKEFWPESF